jgi:zinc protease
MPPTPLLLPPSLGGGPPGPRRTPPSGPLFRQFSPPILSPLCYFILMLRYAWLALALCLCAPAQQVKVQDFTLANGMKVLVHEDHDVPNVAMYFFFKIGSRNERPGTTGLSHFFEHMMFNGAKKYGFKQFDTEMEKAGGRNNAYTTNDDTVYTDWFPRSALELMFDMEADRIRDLSFDPKVIASERGVVYSERRLSVDNSPFGALNEQLEAAAFTAHPYGWPVVGWPSDIESWTMDDLKTHFRMGYSPNNCVMVVTGDVTLAEIQALAKKYLEPIPSHEPPPPVRTREPEQQGERRVTLKRPANLPILMLAYHVPETKDPVNPTLEILEALLTTGRSSRLYRRLVEQDQLVLNVRGGASLAFDPALFEFSMQVRSGVDPARAEAALYDELARLASGGVSAEELQKAKTQKLAEFYRGLKTIAGKANLIGQFEVFYGDYHLLNNVPATLQKVTADDVKQAAAKYFKETNRTVATLLPVRGGAQ